jgi:SAM-dependent methyltransferase
VALQPTEVAELEGRIAGQRCLHLQCHIGTDTLSLLHAGAAAVVGLDFSGKALEQAAALAAEAGIAGDMARWVQSDVYDAPEALEGETFGLVFVNVGSLCWLHDIKRWARAVGRCIAPGGTFYIRDCHPMAMTLADDATDGYMERPRDAKGARELIMAYPYYEQREPNSFSDEGTYADREWALVECLPALTGSCWLKAALLARSDGPNSVRADI